MHTTGQFTKQVGIETNTMIRWLREGIVVPSPTDGRNNMFTFEEVMAVRAVVPLYQEWSLKADLLRQVAAFMRDLLSVREELGYDSWEALCVDVCLWRFKGLIEKKDETKLPGDELKGYVAGMVDAAERSIEKLGIKLPDNWASDDMLRPTFEGELADRVKRYDSIMRSMSGMNHWHLFVARDTDGDWNWAIGDVSDFRKKFQSDAVSYIVVDLSKALAD